MTKQQNSTGTGCEAVDEADGLRADVMHGVHVVVDAAGGVWWPSDEARAEIEASEDPEIAGIAICDMEPMRGEWRS